MSYEAKDTEDNDNSGVANLGGFKEYGDRKPFGELEKGDHGRGGFCGGKGRCCDGGGRGRGGFGRDRAALKIMVVLGVAVVVVNEVEAVAVLVVLHNKKITFDKIGGERRKIDIAVF